MHPTVFCLMGPLMLELAQQSTLFSRKSLKLEYMTDVTSIWYLSIQRGNAHLSDFWVSPSLSLLIGYGTGWVQGSFMGERRKRSVQLVAKGLTQTYGLDYEEALIYLPHPGSQDSVCSSPALYCSESRLASVPIRCSKCLPERGPRGRSLHESSPRLCKG